MIKTLWGFFLTLGVCLGAEKVDEKLAEQMRADLLYFQQEFPDISELDEVIPPLVMALNEHELDFNKCFLEEPHEVYRRGFEAFDVSAALDPILKYYKQKYFNQQLEYLVVRYGRGRSYLNVALTERGYRESQTENSIIALCSLAKIRGLVVEDNIEDIYKLLVFFNRKEDCFRYFYLKVSEFKTPEERSRFIQNSLMYLIQRYSFDRGYVNKLCEYIGVWKSRTRECIEVLLSIAKSLNIRVDRDFLKELQKVDETLIEEILSYFLSLPESTLKSSSLLQKIRNPLSWDYYGSETFGVGQELPQLEGQGSSAASSFIGRGNDEANQVGALLQQLSQSHTTESDNAESFEDFD